MTRTLAARSPLLPQLRSSAARDVGATQAGSQSPRGPGTFLQSQRCSRGRDDKPESSQARVSRLPALQTVSPIEVPSPPASTCTRSCACPLSSWSRKGVGLVSSGTWGAHCGWSLPRVPLRTHLLPQLQPIPGGRGYPREEGPGAGAAGHRGITKVDGHP